MIRRFVTEKFRQICFWFNPGECLKLQFLDTNVCLFLALQNEGQGITKNL